MVGELAIPNDVQALTKQLNENLEKDRQDWKTRRDLVVKLGQAGIGADRGTQVKVLQTLAARCYEQEDDLVFKSAMEAVKNIWENAWDDRRRTMLVQVCNALKWADTDGCDYSLLREQAAAWVGSKAESISQDERIIGQTLDALLQRIDEDPDRRVREVAWDSSRKIWDASWRTRDDAVSHRLVVIHRFLKVFRLEEEEQDDWEVRKSASDWIATRAGDIAKDERMLNEVVNILIKRSTSQDREEVSKAEIDALLSIWDKTWQSETLIEGRIAALNQLNKALKKGDCELKQAAADWLGKHADDLAKEDRLLTKALDSLYNLAFDKKEADEARQSGRYNSLKLWNASWENNSYHEVVLNEVIEVLNERDDDPHDKEFRQVAIKWIGDHADSIAKSEEMVDRMVSSALKALTQRANYEKDEYTRRIAETALRKIWDTDWKRSREHKNENRQLILIDHVFEAFNPAEIEARQPAPDAKGDPDAVDGANAASPPVRTRMTVVDWLYENAAEIARNRRVSEKVLLALINSLDGDLDTALRSKTIDTIKAIWNSAWSSSVDEGGPDEPGGQAQTSVDQAYRRVILDHVLKDGLKKTDLSGAETLREAAAQWLASHAQDIASSDPMLTESLNALFELVDKFELHAVRLAAREASKELWDKGWTAPSSPNDPEGETKKQLTLNQVLKVLDRSDNENFKLLAVGWLSDHSSGIAANYNMAERAANALGTIRQNRAHQDDVIDGANRAIQALWSALSDIKENKLTNIQKEFDDASENRKVELIRKLSNENTLGSREAVSFLVDKWVKWIQEEDRKKLVELTAEKIRNNKHAVLPLVEHFLQNAQDTGAADAGEKITAAKAGEGGPGPAKTSASSSSAAETSTGELSPAKSNGSTPGAAETGGAEIGDGEAGPAKTNPSTPGAARTGDGLYLVVRQRIARQLADMSDPRFYKPPESILEEYSYEYIEMVRELRNHAVPALARSLPEEKDIEILENVARVLLYTRDREGINALTKEVVGEERTRKARQELLATYYLKPSKESSDQAAEILKKAINESKRTLSILQTLNIAVVIVGLAVLFYGLYFSIMGDAAATRILGGLAAIGGLAGVVYQLVRDPLDRIQNANANMVQMETAFTSFIWELNLNGTYIQSCYVNKGELQENEIKKTDERIEEAMKQTMSLVSIFTEKGKQRLVTRLNSLEPGGGKAGESEIRINGQHLLGDSIPETNGARAGGQPGARATGGGPRKSLGMVAINHQPIDGKDVLDWDENAVRFKLPQTGEEHAGGNETVWISLFIDGMETNALPFLVISDAGDGVADPGNAQG